MSTLLQPDQSARLSASGAICQVERLLGSGGQGEVYRVRLGSTPMALKWYHGEAATPQQRTILESLIKKGAPSEQFLWPLELATADNTRGFGYLMLLREERFKSGVDLMTRRIDPSFHVLATAGLSLANGFLQLHAKGFCYRDISFGNVFLDPNRGDVLICDNDNVGVDGDTTAAVLGTPRFMAPEVVRGEAPPSTATDQFSLAVLLFYMFFLHHPLEGKKEAEIRCFDLPAMTRLYGTEPIFVGNPQDSRNRPVSGLHDNVILYWRIYPHFLKQLFIRAFTDGLLEPASRIKESEWRAAMVRLRDCIIYCAGCGAQVFFDPTEGRNGPRSPPKCWACRNAVLVPLYMQIGKACVMLNHDTRLYPHHLDDKRPYDFSAPVAETTRHPTAPGIWGLRNLSESPWSSTNAAGQPADVPPGKSVALVPGSRIMFGKTEGVITYGVGPATAEA
jgi:eukaryotic-like serine/threonine-protein kinase